jgi:hypothetical protein
MWSIGAKQVLKSPNVTRVEPGTPGAVPGVEERQKRPNSVHFGSRRISRDEWISEQERMEHKRRRAETRQGNKGDLFSLGDHDPDADEEDVVQEGDPFVQPVQIHGFAWTERPGALQWPHVSQSAA